MKVLLKSGIACLLVALCLSACDWLKPKDPVCQSWKLVSRNGDEQDDSLMKAEFRYAFLRLYNNNEYTYLNLRRYAQGKWTLNKKDSLLTFYGFSEGANLVLHVNSANGDWMKGDMLIAQSRTPFLFKADPYFEYKDQDLLSPQSNAWRVKPAHKESKDEIRKRVIAHISYMRDYFHIIDLDERGAFFSGFLQGPVNFYSNGIALTTEDEIPPVWLHIFYDDEDAKAGFQLMVQAIRSINRYPKDTKTYTEGYYVALGEMKDYLEALQ
jgi:hypothetical protein